MKPMPPARWEQVTEAFEAARGCSAAERPAVLDRLCGSDCELRAEVERLLAGEAAAEGFLATPTPPPAPPQLSPGTMLAGRFSVLRLLGEGGMGEVYAARDEMLGTTVAVKLLRRDLSANPSWLEHFKHEVLAARRVSHPNVCRIHDLGFDHAEGRAPQAFLSMELLTGESLAARLQREPRPTPIETRRWLGDMAAGLDAAHAAGVAHRDFKPANVMLVEAGDSTRAVITDFGLAAWGPDATKGGSGTMGTPAYMAPEQWSGDELTPAVDVYAFGVVLRELLTCASASGPPASGLGPVWEQAIAGCLEEDPKLRLATAGAALRLVEWAELEALAPPRRGGLMSFFSNRLRWSNRGARNRSRDQALLARIEACVRELSQRDELQRHLMLYRFYFRLGMEPQTIASIPALGVSQAEVERFLDRVLARLGGRT